MSSLRPIGRFAATPDKDRVSACRFSPCPLCSLFVFSVLILFSFFSSLLSNQHALTHLNATLTSHLTSVDSKQLTANLNPPESTLTKNTGGGVLWLTTHPMRMRVLSERSESKDLS